MLDSKGLFKHKYKKHTPVKTLTCAECHGDGGGINGPDCKVCEGSGVIILKIIDKR